MVATTRPTTTTPPAIRNTAATPPGYGHGHVVAVAHCRHGAERPPDRGAEGGDRRSGRVSLGLQHDQRDVPDQQKRGPDAVDQQARPDGAAGGAGERGDPREGIQQPHRPEGRDQCEDEIQLVSAEPQPPGMRQAQLHEVVDDEHRPDERDRSIVVAEAARRSRRRSHATVYVSRKTAAAIASGQ